MTRTTHYLLNGSFRRLVSHTHGDPTLPTLLCVHGLTRNGRDFDTLADALADRFHILCPDLPGRGGSDWLDGPAGYALPSYLVALSHLIATLPPPISYVGTSLGGILGMALASAPGTPIHRLVLNDVGPRIPAAALAAIGQYVRPPLPTFAALADAEQYFRHAYAAFGTMSDAQWHLLTLHSTRKLGGRLALHYDPAIATAYAATPPKDIDLSAWWNAVTCPTLVLRGEHSALLPAEMLHTMAAKAATLTVPGCGHAPSLTDPPTIAAIRQFLKEGCVPG